jgi:hypothetical protein
MNNTNKMGFCILFIFVISALSLIEFPLLYSSETYLRGEYYKVKNDYEKINVKIINYHKVYENMYLISCSNKNNTYILYNSKNNCNTFSGICAEIYYNEDLLKKYKKNKEILIYDNGKQYVEFNENKIDKIIKNKEIHMEILKRLIIISFITFLVTGLSQYYDYESNEKIKESAKKIVNVIKEYNALKNTTHNNSNNENNEYIKV